LQILLYIDKRNGLCGDINVYYMCIAPAYAIPPIATHFSVT